HRTHHVLADRLPQTQPPIRTKTRQLPGLSRPGSRSLLLQTAPQTDHVGHGLSARGGPLDRRQFEVIYVLHTPVDIAKGKNGHVVEHLPCIVQGDEVLSDLLIELLSSLLQTLARLPVLADEHYGVDYIDGHIAPHVLFVEP
ncbi:hypothetical protein GTY41_33375, partial [Streptomyces sp. SID685]|nr:hypothetical protein [Streptomyces sp. SID685]